MLKKYLFVFFLAMVPIVELRGSIPFAVGFHTADAAFSLPLSYVLIAIGNMIPVPFIFFFARKLLEWGAAKKVIGRPFRWCLEKGHKGGQKLLSGAAGKGVYWALLLFVGIPLPGTGAWTGTLAASILDLNFKKSVLAIIGGVALAGVIMSIVSFAGAGIVSAAG